MVSITSSVNNRIGIGISSNSQKQNVNDNKEQASPSLRNSLYQDNKSILNAQQHHLATQKMLKIKQE